MHNISNNKPVIAFGVIDRMGHCIITGFDESDDVLIGLNSAQEGMKTEDTEFESSGYFRQRNWCSNTPCFIFFEDKNEKPPKDEVFRKAMNYPATSSGVSKTKNRKKESP